MKISILVHSLTNGGAERVASLWAEGFCKRGYEVFLVLSVNEKMPITYKLPGSVSIYYNISYSKIRLVRIITRILNLRKILKREKPSIIIGVLSSFDAYIASVGLGAKFINTEHNSYERPFCAPMPAKVRIRKYFINSLFSCTTVLTQSDKKYIGDKLHNIFVLPNPLSFSPATNFSPKENIILSVGRLDAWHYKGFDILIKAWARISPHQAGWKLNIIGNGENGRKYLMALCDEEGISESVTFIDFQEDILRYYEKAAIFVLRSRYEGFGMVLLEAMSQGCACIACDYKGRQREIITNENEGLICNPEDIIGLSESIKTLIEDDCKRKTIALGGLERAKAFSLDNIMNKWEKILQQWR